jgi:hypothetical protein
MSRISGSVPRGRRPGEAARHGHGQPLALNLAFSSRYALFGDCF